MQTWCQHDMSRWDFKTRHFVWSLNLSSHTAATTAAIRLTHGHDTVPVVPLPELKQPLRASEVCAKGCVECKGPNKALIARLCCSGLWKNLQYTETIWGKYTLLLGMKTFVQDWKCQVAHVPEVFANPVALIALARLVKWHQQSLSSSTLGPAMELSAVQSKHTCIALKGFFESLVNTKMSRVQMTSSHENIWIIKLDQIGACLEVGFDPSPFSWCFVAAQVGHLGKSAPWWFHVGHDTRSPSGSTAEQFRFRHCWVAVAEPQKHCTTKGTGLPFRGKKMLDRSIGFLGQVSKRFPSKPY
jgi:hypothetical protein